MSTRARTRTLSVSKTPTSARSKAASKPKRSDDIENDKPKTTPKTKSKRTKSPTPAIYCLCRKGDDGSPMVNCGECDEWYHFGCISLSEQTADDINVYICAPCTEKTGRRTVMLWEGPDAVEDASKTTSLIGASATATAPKKEALDPPDSPEEDPDTEDDEYVADKTKGSKVRSRLSPPIYSPEADPSPQRRRARRLSFSSEESGSDDDASEKGGRARKPASPGASSSNGRSQLKRKAAAKAHAPPPKRKKASASASGDATDDPARAFCLGKLEGVFRDIFLRYPHVRAGGEGPPVEKKAEELSEEEKAGVEGEAKQFATDLERCVYDTYSEPDKQGKPSAGGKYKDRFRMLQFNLSKIDRTVLHKRIASADITPKEISLMSSTDLANEQTKQSIKIAEKEALEHSILEKTAIPRAKITHKGLEDIEGVDNEVANLRERQLERQQREEEEKRERERAARLRAQRQRTTSVSVPPESPTTPGGGSWGGPPRVPIHAMTPTEEVFGGQEMSLEPEMNLADLINIDDELQPTPAQEAVASSPSSTSVPALLAPSSPISGFGKSLSPPALPSPTLPTTGISPFASKPEPLRTSSFDLNSLWAAPKKDDSPPAMVDSPPQQTHSPVPIEEPQERKEEAMDLDEPDDKDFDMFLEEKDADVAAPTPEALQAAFDGLPQVWSGKINMPLDSTIPQETPVVARQMAGRTLESGSVLWKTLFPSELLRIDGRVPVDKSAQFLLHTRMNSTKELIAVAFTPGSPSGNPGFQILMDFLIAKGRHGLVFPWGSRPKDHHPGKELYIIPLLSSDTLPDYMELLDNLQLPKVRNTNYLIGIWVLNKGKLAPPLPPPAPVAVPPAPAPSAAIPQFTMPAIPPAAPGMPAPQLTFEPSVLAAEVAALTPEQVRLMLQSLTATTLNAIPGAAAPLAPQPPPPAPQQAWGHPGVHGPQMGYPQHGQHGMGHHASQQHGLGQPYGRGGQQPYDRRDYNNDPHMHPGGYDHGGGRDGWNNRGRGRGRGRGGPGGDRGGGDRGGPPTAPIDSGWPRRRDNGPPSPSQRRWN
ncbi:hypothetical protein C8F04DRAFT_1366635 [Mycena alexandri]|uniref:Transcription factor BYE1 n=1 Tax=Mycena alexandri TaxID=1745969 RepID=A0AAD6TE26_9AGAR|nr:hypothetical protein C8F04DRAFT_1366635 [Mycena alexandri]